MQNEKRIETTGAEPHLRELYKELSQALSDIESWKQQVRKNHNIRFCLWDGQSEDGRKHGDALGKEPFPWEGASDTRIRLADIVINDSVRLMKSAFRKARLQGIPVGAGSSNYARAKIVSELLQWSRQRNVDEYLKRPVDLVANWRQQDGMSVTGIFWEQETRLENQEWSLEQLRDIATKDASIAAMLEMLFSPLEEDVLIKQLKTLFSHLNNKTAKRIIKDLREKGVAQVSVPSVISNRPKWVPLRVGRDVLFPANTTDLQKAAFVAHREILTETELRERVITQDWDEKWVEEVLKYKGQLSDSDWCYSNRNFERNEILFNGEAYKDHIEVWYMYYKSSTEEGYQQIWCTVSHPSVKDLYAKHELSEYEHGKYPYIAHIRENIDTHLLSSRGIPEIVENWQQEIKTQRDYRTDRASISIIPPLRVPANRGKQEIVLGPRAQIPERRPNEYGWMSPPPFDQGTIEIEKASRNDADEYCGTLTNWSPNMPVLRQQLHQDDLVGDWLTEMKLCMVMTFQLMQQYMQPVEIVRITNSVEQVLHVSKEDVRGQYDVLVEFDVRDLDTEYLWKKLEAIGKALPLDTMGVTDRANLIKVIFQAIDPVMARDLVRDMDSAAQQEVEDEQVQFSKIYAGIEPIAKESGQNFQLRAQTLQGIIGSNSLLQQRMQVDETFNKLVNNRLKHFQFMMQQQQNAQIGRTGVKSVLQGAQ